MLKGYWWAFVQALQARHKAPSNKQQREDVRQMIQLAKSCTVDLLRVTDLGDLPRLAFQRIEDTEEQRRNYGFSGARRMLCVRWGYKENENRQGRTEDCGDFCFPPQAAAVARRD